MLLRPFLQIWRQPSALVIQRKWRLAIPTQKRNLNQDQNTRSQFLTTIGDLRAGGAG